MGSEIEIRGIAKSYVKGKHVLKPIDLTVHAGELFFLLGSSGCGKSTLLRIIAGLLAPDCGKILFDGRDISSLPPEKRRAAMVFQNYALWPHMNVIENVAFGLRTAGGLPNREILNRAMDALKVVRLEECADRKIMSLSGGQQQRVALARALAVDPAVLLLDEPLSNLDARLRDEMRLEIRRICKERNLTAIYVTHDRREALSMADRIAVLNEGTLRQTGTPRELYRNPSERFVAGFLGDANIFQGKIISVSEGRALFETPQGKFTFAAGDRYRTGMSGEIMIRPGAFRFRAHDPADAMFRMTLKEGTFLGERTEWLFDFAGMETLVYESYPPEREAGKEYELFAGAEDIVPLPESFR